MLSVTSGATLAEVLNTLATNRLHRIYVVDAGGAPTSIITLTDLLRFAASH